MLMREQRDIASGGVNWNNLSGKQFGNMHQEP